MLRYFSAAVEIDLSITAKARRSARDSGQNTTDWVLTPEVAATTRQ